MKKHIVGLAVFSFIVGATAIIYAFFSCPETALVYRVNSTPQFISREITHYETESAGERLFPKIRQAVYTLPTRQLSLQMEFPDGNQPVDLLFFSKDSRRTRFIDGERIQKDSSRGGIQTVRDFYDWLNKTDSGENLYVIAQTASESRNYAENYQVNGNKFEPKFDAARATAVTVDYGK